MSLGQLLTLGATMSHARLVRYALLVSMSIVMLLAGCAETQPTPSDAMLESVRADIDQVMADIEADPDVGASSNPWDYVGVSPTFPRLIARGEPALEAIALEIEGSEENGLREYLLAMAGNSILGKDRQYGDWDNAKGWLALYRADH